MRHLAGTVGVVSGETARYVEFYQSLQGLVLPQGSQVMWASGCSVVQNHELLAERTVGGWLWILGDDHVFEPTLLLRLLDLQLPVVVPLVTRRVPPLWPVLYGGRDSDGQFMLMNPSVGLEEPLVDVYAAGSAGMLVRKTVLKELRRPLFSADESRPDLLGLSPDLVFCERLREAMVPVVAATELVMGHLNTVVYTPSRDEKGWHTRVRLAEGASVKVVWP